MKAPTLAIATRRSAQRLRRLSPGINHLYSRFLPSILRLLRALNRRPRQREHERLLRCCSMSDVATKTTSDIHASTFLSLCKRLYDKNQYNLSNQLSYWRLISVLPCPSLRAIFHSSLPRARHDLASPQKKLSRRSTWFEGEFVGEIP